MSLPVRQAFRRSRGFSLIELLTVIGVIVILMAFIVPAVSNFGRATGLTSAGNMVTHLTALARQTAISKSTLTALVMLGDQGTPADYRAFTVLEYTAGQGWSQISKWEILPEGIVVDRSNLQDCSFLQNSPRTFPFLAGPPTQENPPVVYKDEQVRDPEGYAARIFLPHGGLQNPEWPAQIRLVEGFVQGDEVVYTRRGDAPGQTANYYDVAIVGATGIAKVSRP